MRRISFEYQQYCNHLQNWKVKETIIFPIKFPKNQLNRVRYIVWWIFPGKKFSVTDLSILYNTILQWLKYFRIRMKRMSYNLIYFNRTLTWKVQFSFTHRSFRIALPAWLVQYRTFLEIVLWRSWSVLSKSCFYHLAWRLLSRKARQKVSPPPPRPLIPANDRSIISWHWITSPFLLNFPGSRTANHIRSQVSSSTRRRPTRRYIREKRRWPWPATTPVSCEMTHTKWSTTSSWLLKVS